jgi:hypothetical protein
MSRFMSICPETRNSRCTFWLPEIITLEPFVRTWCVNTRWKGIKVIYNFCVEYFSKIYIIWGQQLVLWWLLTPDIFYPKVQNCTKKVADLISSPNLKGSWAMLHFWPNWSFSQFSNKILPLLRNLILFPRCWLNSALWPCSQVSITLVRLTRVSRVRVHEKLERVPTTLVFNVYWVSTLKVVKTSIYPSHFIQSKPKFPAATDSSHRS